MSYLRADDGARIDSEWSTAVARLATSADATVLPVFFHGANSRWFYLAGRMHPALRAALLVRELPRKRGRTIHLRTGSPIPTARLRRPADARARTEYLRTRTSALGAPAAPAREPAPPTLERIADPEPMLGMAQEIAALPPEQILLRSGAFMVCMGSAAELPHVVREIGRLREVAFRAVSEGSGRARDLDRFDVHYQHLIVWNPECGEVLGSYRIGETDRILRRFGIGGTGQVPTSDLCATSRQPARANDPCLHRPIVPDEVNVGEIDRRLGVRPSHHWRSKSIIDMKPPLHY